jgi:hypothetical protein
MKRLQNPGAKTVTSGAVGNAESTGVSIMVKTLNNGRGWAKQTKVRRDLCCPADVADELRLCSQLKYCPGGTC